MVALHYFQSFMATMGYLQDGAKVEGVEDTVLVVSSDICVADGHCPARVLRTVSCVLIVSFSCPEDGTLCPDRVLSVS